jgi:predicted Fe-Mo cluster-binding NifX family protein
MEQLEAQRGMLTEFDQNTIANMTAALEHVCKRIPQGRDSHEIRKRLAEAMVACGHDGRRSLIDFQNAGMRVLEEILRPPKYSWFGLWRSKRR